MAVQDQTNQSILANISLSHAATWDPLDPGTEDEAKFGSLAAADYDEAKHKHLHFYCADCLEKNHFVRLKKPEAGRHQNITFEITDPVTGEVLVNDDGVPQTTTRRYYFPPRFTRWPGTNQHACDAARIRTEYNNFARENGGLALDGEKQVFRFNLNIPCGQKIISRRPRMTANTAATFQASARPSLYQAVPSASRSKASKGIQSITHLALLLEATAANKEMRKTTYLSLAGMPLSLNEIYHDDPIALFRDLHVQARLVQQSEDRRRQNNHARLFLFKPNGNRRFWYKQPDGSYKVLGQAKQIKAIDNQVYHVGVSMHFANAEMFEAFKEAYMEKGEKSFLIYSEQAHLDLRSFAEKKRAILDGSADDHGIYAEMAVHDPAQIMPWREPKVDRNISLTLPAAEQQNQPALRAEVA